MCFVYSRKDVSRNFEVVSDKNCVGFCWNFKNVHNNNNHHFKTIYFIIQIEVTMVNFNRRKYRIVN